MENLSHSAAGFLIAELALCSRERRGKVDSPLVKNVVRWLSVLANNFPDADLFLTWLTPGPLGYLLHHRGVTHTIVGAIPQAGLLWLGARWELSRREARPARSLDGLLFLIALVGVFLHIGLDAMNSYGVHPFWPFDDRWYYADTLFIAEPWLWLSWLPLFWWMGTSLTWKAGVLVPIVVSLLLLWLLPFVPWPVALCVTAWGFAVWLVGEHLDGWRRACGGVGAGLTVLLVFALASQRTRVLFLHHAPRDWRIADVALTPHPANPFCWDAIGISSRDGHFELSRATVAPFPAMVPARRCRYFHPGGLVPLHPLPLSDDASLVWRGGYAMEISEWKRLAAEPFVLAFLRFARAPFFLGNGRVIGDFRFDRGPGGGFATFANPGSQVDPVRVPPWDPPRRDLLLSP